MPPKQLITKILGPMVLNFLKSKGITLSMCAAAYYLIPDHAVMSKEELSDNTQLSQKELVLRKAAVVMTVLALKGAVKTTVDLTTLLKSGSKPTIMHAAKLLMAAPAFLTTYKVVHNRIEKGEGSMNIREFGPTKTQAAGAKAAQLAGYGTMGYTFYNALKNMPKPPNH